MRILQVAFTLSVILLTACGSQPGAAAKRQDTQALFTGTRLPDLNGVTRALAEYSGEKGLLLTFADAKCPFSATASKELPTVAATFSLMGITTVFVNLGDPEAEVRKAYGAGIAGTTVVYDVTRRTQQDWNVRFVPHVVLLDSAGQVIYRGSPVWADVAASLAQRLNLPSGSVKPDARGTMLG
jgi:thioredoxin-related protein